jgi:small GTP-binding protein
MELKKKVVLLGDSSVGKTSLIRRFVLDQFDDSYIVTIGTKVTRKDLRLPRAGGEADVSLLIWDILGRAGYSAFHARNFAGVHGAILVADVTRKETLDNLERYWIPSLFSVVENVPLVFVGNKADLPGHEFGGDELAALASRYNVGLGPAPAWHVSSAKTGENVEACFRGLGTLLLQDRRPEDPVRELYERLVADGISRSTDKSTAIGALDAIIVDFCEKGEGRFENDLPAMDILREEILRAGLDVRHPSREGLLRVVDYFAEVESQFHPAPVVTENRERRLGWVHEARS